jgi:beta-galactosidase
MKKIYFGGDYNPEQWDEITWIDDMEKMGELKANTLTINVFSWSKLQPAEDRYQFDLLDKIMDMAVDNNLHVVLATPTASQPPWMIKKYPDMLIVDKWGNKRKFGGRTQFCPNNSDYRRLAGMIASKLAERYKDHKALTLWHVNNEYGTYCYCETCRLAFIQWLKEKYTSLENLNEKWYTQFWGHLYYDWDEIQVVSAQTELLPGRLGNRDGTNFQGMAVDYCRFMSDSIIDCFHNEADVIRKITPQIPVTTNIWGIAPSLDLFKLGKAVDVVSWDSYPSNNEHYSVSSFKNDIIRSLKKERNFLVMEQTPSQQNWQDFNAQKRPGVMRLLSYQAMAHGSDGLLFFQVRQSKGACEKYHAALIPHAGHLNTRTGRELIALGRELESISDKIPGTKVHCSVALVMNWDNWWSVEYSSGPSIDLNYFEILHKYYKVLNALNVQVDIVQPGDDFTSYSLVVAPVLNMLSSKDQENIERYVESGGVFLSTYFSGCVDEFDLIHPGGYPGALKKIMGIWVEEVDALYRGETNEIISPSGNYSCSLLCEVIHLEGAKALAYFGRDYYKGFPSVTENFYGKGKAVYLGTQPEESYLENLFLKYLRKDVLRDNVQSVKDIELQIRENYQNQYLFILNHSEEPKEMQLGTSFRNIFSGELLKGQLSISGKDVIILEKV